MKTPKRVLAAIGGVAFAANLGIATPAFAETDEPATPTRTALSVASNGATAKDAPEFSPAHCMGQTNDPHPSGHNPGVINVTATTKDCLYNQITISVSTVLSRSRWYGWEQRGSSGTITRYQTIYAQATANSPYCRGDVHDWKAESHHEVRDPNGKTYTADTSKRRNAVRC